MVVDSESSDPPSPSRAQRVGEQEERGRPRFFDAKAKARCWQSADVVPGRHPERWRRDPAGNVVCKRFYNCQGCLCFEYDHIIPYSKGGESIAENCQILQTRVNRYKSDKEWVDKKELQGFSCDIKFTGDRKRQHLLMLMMMHYCLLTMDMMFVRCDIKSSSSSNKELDIIEMAVYGDVVRPGHECRCRTVAEMLGKVKSKKPVAACKLPYEEGSRIFS